MLKVIKRDGRTVPYDRNKIIVAIRKANAEVDAYERVEDDMIDGIVAGIEGTGRAVSYTHLTLPTIA